MFHIIYIRYIVFGVFSFCMITLGQGAFDKTPSHLLFPLRSLFSHSNHKESFQKLQISCTECHNFSLKSIKKGPLAPGVDKGFIQAPKHVCHQCHFGKVSLPRPNQCKICHSSSEILKPKNHFVLWQKRHGKLAQFDKDACSQCHTVQSCDQCHTKLDAMNPSVHRSNFRLYHSIEVRMDPQSCMACHRSTSFCSNCHFGKRQ